MELFKHVKPQLQMAIYNVKISTGINVIRRNLNFATKLSKKKPKNKQTAKKPKK